MLTCNRVVRCKPVTVDLSVTEDNDSFTLNEREVEFWSLILVLFAVFINDIIVFSLPVTRQNEYSLIKQKIINELKTSFHINFPIPQIIFKQGSVYKS